MKSKFQPLGNRVLVKRFDPETETLGGLILPTSAQERKGIGVVIAMGDGVTELPRVTDGTLIVFLPQHGGDKVANEFVGLDDNGDYLIIREDYLVGYQPVEQPDNGSRETDHLVRAAFNTIAAGDPNEPNEPDKPREGGQTVLYSKAWRKSMASNKPGDAGF